jgi:hypothetical protein
MYTLRHLCRDIAFVEGSSILSLDDDHVRTRSQRTGSSEYSHMNNAVKG